MLDSHFSFTFQTTPKIHFGAGVMDRIPAEVKRYAPPVVFLVSDPGVMRSGVVERVMDRLSSSGCRVEVFADIEPDPRIETAEACARALSESGATLVIGVGGGSSMDIAKIAAVLASGQQPIGEMFGIDQVKAGGLPLFLVPTTAGTGSEVTHIAILSDERERLKKGVVSAHLFPDVAFVDPLLTVGVPPAVTAASGMDALLHAVEAFTSKNASDITDTLARQAMRLISANLRSAYADGSNIGARTGMLEGSMLAGMAFANAGVTAVHAFAYPIGAEFHIPHGVANSIMMGPVLTFNLIGNLQKFSEVADHLAPGVATGSLRQRAALGIELMKQLSVDIRIPEHLAEFGVRDSDIPSLAANALKVTRLLANNPRTLTLDDAIQIYRQVL